MNNKYGYSKKVLFSSSDINIGKPAETSRFGTHFLAKQTLVSHALTPKCHFGTPKLAVSHGSVPRKPSDCTSTYLHSRRGCISLTGFKTFKYATLTAKVNLIRLPVDNGRRRPFGTSRSVHPKLSCCPIRNSRFTIMSKRSRQR